MTNTPKFAKAATGYYIAPGPSKSVIAVSFGTTPKNLRDDLGPWCWRISVRHATTETNVGYFRTLRDAKDCGAAWVSEQGLTDDRRTI